MNDEILPQLLDVAACAGDPRAAAHLRRRAKDGELVRVHPGRFVDAGAWHALGPRERLVLRAVAAAGRALPRLVVSHVTAAAVHDLPRLGSWPERVHVVDPAASRTTVDAHVTKHAAPLDGHEVVSAAGLRVTSPVRTALDLALTQPHRQAVVALDAMLHSRAVTGADLLAGLDAHPARRGRASARRALDVSDGSAESPGETLCRLVLVELGAPVPVLQREFDVGWRRPARVDFWFPAQGVVLEFDGLAKYTEDRWLGDRSPGEVAAAEKQREDRLRRHPQVATVVRCTWWHLEDPRRLRALLVEAGVPCR